jgi:ribosome-binding protein aMBF1 (putative translation factor)
MKRFLIMKYDIKKLERARILKGWNKSKLARVIGVDPAVIGRVESGENENVVTIKKMVDALDIEMSEILLQSSDHSETTTASVLTKR